MSLAGAVLLTVAGAVVAAVLTGFVRRRAVRRGQMDHPNVRSSHTIPTPRGGGLAIVAVVLVGTAAGALLGKVPPGAALALCGGGAAVAGVGWLDDRRGLSARYRAVVHAAAGVWALAWLGGLPELGLGEFSLSLGGAGWALGMVGIVWSVNAYNFMDGIDGIAAVQALVAGGAGGALLLAAGAPGLAWSAFLIAGAAGGFLAWNRPPARIFMGDVGSGALGFFFAVLAVASERAGALPLLGWLLLLGVFFFDATLTLLRRAARGEPWHQAHRSHAYQRIVQAGWSHGRATATAGALALVLAAGAALALLRPRFLPAAAAAAAAMLCAAYLWVELRAPMKNAPPVPSQSPRS